MGFHFREIVREGFRDEGVDGGYVFRFLEVDEFGKLLEGKEVTGSVVLFERGVIAIVVDDWLRYWIFKEEKPHYRLF